MYSSRKDARNSIVQNQIETSEFRPMGNSRWGDIIDVFTGNVNSDILIKYKVIILLDQVKLDEKLISKLRDVMANRQKSPHMRSGYIHGKLNKNP